jgi:hypothetical protein
MGIQVFDPPAGCPYNAHVLSVMDQAADQVRAALAHLPEHGLRLLEDDQPQRRRALRQLREAIGVYLGE